MIDKPCFSPSCNFFGDKKDCLGLHCPNKCHAESSNVYTLFEFEGVLHWFWVEASCIWNDGISSCYKRLGFCAWQSCILHLSSKLWFVVIILSCWLTVIAFLCFTVCVMYQCYVHHMALHFWNWDAFYCTNALYFSFSTL